MIQRSLLAIFEEPLERSRVNVSVDSLDLGADELIAKEIIDKITATRLRTLYHERYKDCERLPNDATRPNFSLKTVFGRDSCEIRFTPDGTTYQRFLALCSNEDIQNAYSTYVSMVGVTAITFEAFYRLFKPLPIACCSTVITSDNYFVCVKRGDKVRTYKNSYHVPGGYMDQDDTDPFKAMEREITEEVPGVNSSNITSMKLLGIDMDRRNVHPECLFITTVDVTADQIKASVAPDPDGVTRVLPIWRYYLPALEKLNALGRVVPTGANTLWLTDKYLHSDWGYDDLQQHVAPFQYA